jgi:hypothetical protein
MPGYVITSVFTVSGGKAPLGTDVLARAWGMGHRFSYCDGSTLTLVAELTAIDTASAFEALLSRAEMVWTGLGGDPLGAPLTLRVQGAVQGDPVPAGIPPLALAEPSALDTLADESRARRGRRAARQFRWFSPLRGRFDTWPSDVRGNDDPPDDGGLAGVREPRRPRPSLPSVSAARPVPEGPRPMEAVPDLSVPPRELPSDGLPDAVGL